MRGQNVFPNSIATSFAADDLTGAPMNLHILCSNFFPAAAAAVVVETSFAVVIEIDSSN
jgi:hypothetical protein